MKVNDCDKNNGFNMTVTAPNSEIQGRPDSRASNDMSPSNPKTAMVRTDIRRTVGEVPAMKEKGSAHTN